MKSLQIKLVIFMYSIVGEKNLHVFETSLHAIMSNFQ